MKFHHVRMNDENTASEGMLLSAHFSTRDLNDLMEKVGVEDSRLRKAQGICHGILLCGKGASKHCVEQSKQHFVRC